MEDDFTLLSDEIRKAAVRRAMKILEYADRTEKQLRDRLTEEEYPPEAVEEAVSYVKSFHYLDDERYAEILIRSKKASKSAFELKLELESKGISPDLAQEVLERSEISDSDTVCSLFLKKYGHKVLTDPKTYEKAFRYFSSKGFSYPDIKEGIAGALEETEE